MFGPTVSPQLVQSGKGRIASDPALLNLPRPLMAGAFFRPWQRRTNLWPEQTNLRPRSERLRGIGPPVVVQRMLRSSLGPSWYRRDGHQRFDVSKTLVKKLKTDRS